VTAKARALIVYKIAEIVNSGAQGFGETPERFRRPFIFLFRFIALGKSTLVAQTLR
jgi:hypothetical protein